MDSVSKGFVVGQREPQLGNSSEFVMDEAIVSNSTLPRKDLLLVEQGCKTEYLSPLCTEKHQGKQWAQPKAERGSKQEL